MADDNPLNNKNVLRGAKYHVPSRGITGKDQIWRIYMDLANNRQETEYVERLLIRGVPSWTGENALGIGYSLICKGYVSFDYNPDNNSRVGIIHDGSYKPSYTKDKDGKIIKLD